MMIIFSSFSGVIFDGVILEGAFNSARQEIPVHPFTWVNFPLLIFGLLFLLLLHYA